MKNDMIDRYIYAVTKRMNPKIREDVSKELYALVDDMLMERCGDAAPTEKDIRVVLTELGSPQELYAKYDEDSNQCLIAQPYYSAYKFVLKIVLTCVIAGLTMASLILQIMEPQDWMTAIGEYVVRVWDTALGMFAFLTILFAVFHRKGVRLSEGFNLDELPTVPQKKEEISRWECVAGIVFCVVFMVVFLAVPQIFSAVITETGECIPVFNVEVIRSHWYILALFALAGIVRETVKFWEKRYNSRVLAVTLAVDLGSAGLAAWWLLGDRVMNEKFLANMQTLFAGDKAFLIRIFENFNVLLLAVIAVALLGDMIETMFRTVRK